MYTGIRVFPASHPDHGRDIIILPPHHGFAIGGKIEKCNFLPLLSLGDAAGFPTGCLRFLSLEKPVRCALPSREGSVNFHPFHPAQGMFLVAAPVHEHRDMQILDHFLHIRCVIDHGGLNGQIAPPVHQHFIIRFAVFSGVHHGTGLHALPGRRESPAALSKGGHGDLIQGACGGEQGHGGRGGVVDVGQRLTQDDGLPAGPRRNLLPLRHHQISAAVRHCDEPVSALITVDAELIRILSFHLGLVGKAPDLPGVFVVFCV